MVRKTLYLLVTILICTLAGVGLVIKQLKLRTNQAQQAQQQLLTISLTDSLTGIANRRHFDQYFEIEWRRAKRTQTSLAVALFDVDDFKSYNDNYGHQDGDIALQKITQIMATSVQRASDLLARYGGEEFILLLPNTDIAGAAMFCDKIRQQIFESQIEHQHSRTAQVITISVGVAAVVPTEGLDPLSLIKAADAALYQAKSQGRNCVCQ
jgi:diguanylate cyclase (GGDEF)-like protein